MFTDQSAVVVIDGMCACCAVHTKHIYHRHFPEIRGEAGTVADALAHLARQLSRAREGARDGWQRDGVDRALADVAEYLEALPDPGQEGEVTWRCGASGPCRLASSLSGHGPSR